MAAIKTADLLFPPPESYRDLLRQNIARRTVAKYREQLNVPVARLRKEL